MRSRSDFRGSGREEIQCDLAHGVPEIHRVLLVRCRHILPAGIGIVLVAESREALGDTHAGAVELTDDPRLLLRRRPNGRRVDEVARPPERERFVREAERRHDLGHVLLDEAVREVRELGLVRAVERVDRAGAANRRDAALLRLLVDDAHELRADKVVTELTLHDARAEALVDELATGFLPTLEVLARPLGGPSTAL